MPKNTSIFILTLNHTPSILHPIFFNFQPHSRGWSLTWKKPFLFLPQFIYTALLKLKLFVGFRSYIDNCFNPTTDNGVGGSLRPVKSLNSIWIPCRLKIDCQFFFFWISSHTSLSQYKHVVCKLYHNVPGSITFWGVLWSCFFFFIKLFRLCLSVYIPNKITFSLMFL